MAYLAFFLVVDLALYCGAHSHEKDLIDLTIDLKTNETRSFPFWPYSYERLDIMDVEVPGVLWVEAYGFKMSIHTGTHIDAPCHIRPDDNGTYHRLHEVPLERFFGPGCVIDVKAKVDADDGYVLAMEDVTAWEKEHGQIPKRAVVLIHTGWAKRNGATQESYWGSDDLGNHSTWVHPSVHKDVAEFLVEERDINAVGLDAGTIDTGRSQRAAHLAILGKNRIIIENIASSLEHVPATGYRIHIVPIKLYDTCGAPVRLLAFKEPEEIPSGAIRMREGLSGFVVVVLGFLIVIHL